VSDLTLLFLIFGIYVFLSEKTIAFQWLILIFILISYQYLSHYSIELQAILLHCSLDSPVLIYFVIRTLKLSPFFIAISSLRYTNFYLSWEILTLITMAWGDTRIDEQGDAILRTSNAHNMIIIVHHHGFPTFISSLGHASSLIDLFIASRDLRLLSSTSILQDLHGSDHFPVSISVAETSPSTDILIDSTCPIGSFYLYILLHSTLAHEAPKFYFLIFFFSAAKPTLEIRTVLLSPYWYHLFILSSWISTPQKEKTHPMH